MNVINTRADLDSLRFTNPAAHAAFIAKLQGSLTQLADVRQYPADYDHTLKEGDESYLAPQVEAVPDDTAATRYGFTRAELLAL